MKELDYKQSKRVVLAKYPRAFIQAFSGYHLCDGSEGILLSESRKYGNDMFEQHWIDAAKRIQDGLDV